MLDEDLLQHEAVTVVTQESIYRADLEQLVSLFHSDPRQLGEFKRIDADDLPAAYQQLLAHEHHMTVTVEAFFGQQVDVRVLHVARNEHYYWREIVLVGQRDGRVLQYGIVRLCFDWLEQPVRREIELQQTPLGRVLIEHGVLREVELLNLWQVTAGPALRRCLMCSGADTTYGRTALIHCNGEPAVELLEIMTPEVGRRQLS